MKRAFTLIELIFVIVIIGILSIIALPRLNATRTDAKVSVILANLKQVTIDSASFYSARGEIEWTNAKVENVTDVPLFKDTDCKNQAININMVGNRLYICDDDKSVVKIDANRTHIQINKGDSSSLIANSVYNSKLFKALNIPNGIRLGGVNVKK
jgi:prepilin-type N-terminal cleavage/methylation domain-containing protein